MENVLTFAATPLTSGHLELPWCFMLPSFVQSMKLNIDLFDEEDGEIKPDHTSLKHKIIVRSKNVQFFLCDKVP